MSPTKTISAHNHFIGAVWAAVHYAQKTRTKCFCVVRLPSQKRWSVVIGQTSKQKAKFTVHSYRRRAGHRITCAAAGVAIRKWEQALYKELVATGKTKHIPRRVGNNTHEHLLKMAVLQNNVNAVDLLIGVGADANYDVGKPLRIAVRHNHQALVLSLLKGGASVKAMRKLLYAPQFSGTPKRWLDFLTALADMVKHAGLDENLTFFDELVEIAQEPASRKIIGGLTGQYPRLLAKLL